MDMKKRHHVQASIVGSKLQKALDVVRGGVQVGMCQRYNFWPRSRPRGMQHQCDIVGFGERGAGVAVGGKTKHTGGVVLPYGYFQNLNTEFSCRCPSRGFYPGGGHQRFGIEILQVKGKLVEPDRRD